MMLALFATALLGAQPDSILVRGAARDTTLFVAATPTGGALRADVVIPLLGGAVRDAGGGRWSVTVGGATIELADGVPFATHKGETLPLATAPVVRDGALLLPLDLLTGLVPQLGDNLIWDADHRELRVFRGVVRRTIAPPGKEPRVASANATTPSRKSARRHVVVVDAGHGGPDAGMRGPIGGRTTLYEKDITLAVAKLLAGDLQDRGVDVVMTRSTDTLIALSDRGRIANQRKGDLFISVHVNAANLRWKDPRGARGFETYFLADAKTEDERRVAQMENESVKFETSVETRRDDPLGFILNDMAQNEHLRESSDLAATVQQRLRRMHPGPNRGVKQAGFRVLVTAFMPSVLVEIGFGTNASEAAWLSSTEGQREIATAVADAAMEYLGHYERRVAGFGASPGGRE
jgi:N-acetylmuramoyl-L-alanine amidase